MASAVVLRRLEWFGYRNLLPDVFEPSSSFNVLHGDNGQGKTNVLEAIYVLATSKSFRTSKMGELVAHGAERARLVGKVVADGLERTHHVEIDGRSRRVRLDDKRPRTLAEFARKTPIVVFHPGEMLLSIGPSSERRRLLDRVGLFTAPDLVTQLDGWTKSARSRQRLLEMGDFESRALAAYEEVMANHGVALCASRHRIAAEIAEAAGRAFERIAEPGLAFSCDYDTNTPESVAAFASELASNRRIDARRKSPSVGPHRDDIVIALRGHAARSTASQGQHRAIVLALKAAEIELLREATGSHPILLLDDVSSELDRERTTSLLAFVSTQRGQVFLTTTRPELITLGDVDAERRDFAVRRGAVQSA